jgi:hypothetical protein
LGSRAALGAQLTILALVLGLSTARSMLRAPAALQVGLNPEQQQLVEAVTAHTSAEARILWEDRGSRRRTSGWTALLPMLTERVYLGGLDPRADFDFAYAGLVEPNLAGRALADWTDTELLEFCRRYNIGWVVCWSPAVVARFQSAGLAEATLPLPPEPGFGPVPAPGCLFTLRRTRSFILKGQARWVRANCERITLADVVPEDGKVVLSLHYQKGLRVSPGRIQIEREPDAHDPIPFIRLRLLGPATRVTLTWGER